MGACTCRADAHFVDPLMDVTTPREIHLAFYSLIKLFASVETEQKSLTWASKPELPSSLKASDVQQVVLPTSRISSCKIFAACTGRGKVGPLVL